MPKKSETGKLVRRSADECPQPSPADVKRLLTAMEGPIDTSDIPEWKGPFGRLPRDAEGRLLKKPESPIRSAILAELSRSTKCFAHSNRIDQILLNPLVFSQLRVSVGFRRPQMAPSQGDYLRSDPLLPPFFVDFAPLWG